MPDRARRKRVLAAVAEDLAIAKRVLEKAYGPAVKDVDPAWTNLLKGLE